MVCFNKKIRKPLNVTLTFLTKDLIDFPQILVKKKEKKKKKEWPQKSLLHSF